jgi:hypothetical protein
MTWLWMYMNWVEDINEKHRFAKDYSIFLGSFHNSEAAHQMLKAETPDFETTDEEFDEATMKMMQQSEQIDKMKETESKSLHRRKRKKVII